MLVGFIAPPFFGHRMQLTIRPRLSPKI